MPDLRDADVDASICLPPDTPDIDYEARMQDVKEAIKQYDGAECDPVFEGGELHQFRVDKDYYPPELSVIVGELSGINGLSAWIDIELREPRILQKLHSQVEEAMEMVGCAPDRHKQTVPADRGGQAASTATGSTAAESAVVYATGDVGMRVVPGDRIIREEATTVDSTGRVELGPEYANEDVRVLVVEDDQPAAEEGL